MLVCVNKNIEPSFRSDSIGTKAWTDGGCCGQACRIAYHMLPGLLHLVGSRGLAASSRRSFRLP
jgi:hypothetical protein